jgi:hypothetical protein
MKLELFKKLLKETVKDALREVLDEELNSSSPKTGIETFKPKPLKENTNPLPSSHSDVINSILQETSKSINKEEWTTIANYGSDNVSSLGMGLTNITNTMSEGSALPSGELSLDQISKFLK